MHAYLLLYIVVTYSYTCFCKIKQIYKSLLYFRVINNIQNGCITVHSPITSDRSVIDCHYNSKRTATVRITDSLDYYQLYLLYLLLQETIYTRRQYSSMTCDQRSRYKCHIGVAFTVVTLTLSQVALLSQIHTF